jgi:glutathione S-transferase
VHPLGKSPVITDGGLTLAESGAIIEHLSDRYGAGRLAPAFGSAERVRYLYWLHFAEGTAQPPLLLKLLFDRVKSKAPLLVRPIARAIAGKVKDSFVLPQIRQHLAFLEGELAQRAWFAGDDFSAADIQISFPLEAAAARGGLDVQYPKLSAFLERIHARPAYQRALERGGKYDFVK